MKNQIKNSSNVQGTKEAKKESANVSKLVLKISDSLKKGLGNKEQTTTNSNNSIWNIPKSILMDNKEKNWRNHKRNIFLQYAKNIVESGNKLTNLDREIRNFLLDYKAFINVCDFNINSFCKSNSRNVEKRDYINNLYKELLSISKKVLEDNKISLSDFK